MPNHTPVLARHMSPGERPGYWITNPSNTPTPRGTPTRIIAPDGRIATASWGRPQWMLVVPGVSQGWVDALPEDMAVALAQAS